jgi:hypothetical protein
MNFNEQMGLCKRSLLPILQESLALESQAQRTKRALEVYKQRPRKKRGGEKLQKSIGVRSIDVTLKIQAKKSYWWMPRNQEAKKDALTCENLRGAGKKL